MSDRLILKPTGIDVKLLPLGAVEAFVLSQLDGLLDLESVSEITGIDSTTVDRVAARLVELGAATDAAAAKETKRRDPRAEETLYPPKSMRPPKTVRFPKTVRPPKPATSKTVRPPKSVRPSKSVRPTKSSLPPKSSSHPKSMRAPKAPVIAEMQGDPPPPPPSSRMHAESAPNSGPVSARSARSSSDLEDSVPELDEATVNAIVAVEAKIAKLDHYALFEIERDADKKTIKRAYFALATLYHPDRFFGKKLGPYRARIERIFRQYTDAHDLLVDPARRKSYDATLPPASRPARKPSRVMRAVTRRIEAVTIDEAQSKPPASGHLSESTKAAPVASAPRKTPTSRPAARQSMSSTAPLVPETPAISISPNGPISGKGPASFPLSAPFASAKPVVVEGPASSGSPSGAPSGPTPSARSGDVRAGLMAAKVQARVDMLVKAGEEALAADDIIGAANNYRLALEHREDRRLRFIFEDLDARGRTLRFDKHMVAARAAERDLRWADAAIFLQRANDAKPDCDVASRAATALRLSGGDLDRAAILGEQAVEIAPRNPHYRLALAAVYLANKSPQRAKEESETAKKLAPKDEEVQAMAAEILKKA